MNQQDALLAKVGLLCLAEISLGAKHPLLDDAFGAGRAVAHTTHLLGRQHA